MTGKDEYYNRSKQEGYRARSAYKLKQLDEAANLFSPGDAVVDLGAAPGGWLQVAAEAVGEGGTVVGVDRQRIRPLDAENVETVRGDMTEEATVERLRDAVDGTGIDVVVSDMAPNMTGEYSVDHARSVHLARQALGVARDLLDPGGDLVVKVFDGPDLADLRSDMEESFEYVRSIRPDASRDSSSELYLVAKGYLTAPVSAGDELTVEITDEGREGDGIARVDDFTVFVPDTEVGEKVAIRIEDVKPRFAFAARQD
ncbi:23S rRNA (uridine(2552)-2'-O)-methyltransferase [Haloplanus aerogenes]|uniref:Ribosomal RNA large subunit methyltransferase E n=1 Tax=Haloplanus aerogenes TaxID=660522 RepID=A0A3M0D1C0_9EURY|nr:23S rRNA (uridine(2552)-2'-O)-methyltransferase [Haloplanus aerogenes]AZH23941.1 TRAM domain-containing protein [Haloplanus aerogenes]RMB13296.1 23S rRNA (uridine2552-2'-O)-methyltransferase [Haloplanus aerogenes]